LSSVEGQAAALATLNPTDDDSTQTSLSLDEAVEAVEAEAEADAPESPAHD
jgi:hypothetical protein